MRSFLRLFALAVAAWSAAAFAVPSGHRWFNVPTYVVYPHASVNNIPSGFSTQVLPVIRASYRHWTSQELNCTSYQVQFGGTFTSPSGLDAVDGMDRVNRMLWLGGTSWQYPSNTLAMTTTTFYTGTGEIFDADMEMNNNKAWSITGQSSAYDLESVTTHEAGHFLGLHHTENDPGSVMFPTVDRGVQKQALNTSDITDVCTVYPGTSAGQQGTPCTAGVQCGAGLACRGASGVSGLLCTVDCSGGASCPSGLTCQAARTPAGNGTYACLVAPGAPDLCEFCTTGSDCRSGICLTTGRENYCSSACTGDAQCGPGYTCSEQYCVPSGTTCPQSQCGGDWDCAVGYVCSGGMCTATGNPGDRCEVSLFCGPCSVCVGTYEEASCRACCAGAGQGGSCSACSGFACGSGESCDSILDTGGQQGPDAVCLPQEQNSGTECGACVNDGCPSGLSCWNGRCYRPCDVNAGTCSTCVSLEGTQGLCGCADEVSGEGGPCGLIGAVPYTCSGGALCVDSSCRLPCDASLACGDGFACRDSSAGPICEPTGCGCGVIPSTAAWWSLAALLGFAGRPRRNAA